MLRGAAQATNTSPVQPALLEKQYERFEAMRAEQTSNDALVVMSTVTNLPARLKNAFDSTDGDKDFGFASTNYNLLLSGAVSNLSQQLTVKPLQPVILGKQLADMLWSVQTYGTELAAAVSDKSKSAVTNIVFKEIRKLSQQRERNLEASEAQIKVLSQPITESAGQ